MLLKFLPHVKYWWNIYCVHHVENEYETFRIEPTWSDFVDTLKEEVYLVQNYNDQYMRWIDLQQEKYQVVLEYTNAFHTLCLNMGILQSK